MTVASLCSLATSSRAALILIWSSLCSPLPMMERSPSPAFFRSSMAALDWNLPPPRAFQGAMAILARHTRSRQYRAVNIPMQGVDLPLESAHV